MVVITFFSRHIFKLIALQTLRLKGLLARIELKVRKPLHKEPVPPTQVRRVVSQIAVPGDEDDGRSGSFLARADHVQSIGQGDAKIKFVS